MYVSHTIVCHILDLHVRVRGSAASSQASPEVTPAPFKSVCWAPHNILGPLALCPAVFICREGARGTTPDSSLYSLRLLHVPKLPVLCLTKYTFLLFACRMSALVSGLHKCNTQWLVVEAYNGVSVTLSAACAV